MEVVNLGGAGWVVKGKNYLNETVYLSAYGPKWTKKEENAKIFDSREQAAKAAR